MTIADYKGLLWARQANLQNRLRERSSTATLLEADLERTRSEANMAAGALQATEAALADLEKALPPPSPPPPPAPLS